MFDMVINSLSLVLIAVVDRSAHASEHHRWNRGQVEDNVNDDVWFYKLTRLLMTLRWLWQTD
jgi:hypothetical protein